MTFNRADDAPGPNCPSVAYQVMESILPDWFHRNGPPPSGVHLTVIGKDAVSTQWQMTEGLAGAVVPRLAKHRSILRIVSAYYDERQGAV
jgi:hypothetical protein